VAPLGNDMFKKCLSTHEFKISKIGYSVNSDFYPALPKVLAQKLQTNCFHTVNFMYYLRESLVSSFCDPVAWFAMILPF